MRLEMTRGDTPTFAATVKDRDRQPAVLDGLDLRFTIRRHEGSAPLASLSVGNGLALSPTVGRVLVTIPVVATAGLTRETELVWDLQISDSFGVVETPLLGTLLVRLDVTHD